jgi:hypothetical protein
LYYVVSLKMRKLQGVGLGMGNVPMGEMRFDSTGGPFSKFSPLGSMMSYRISTSVLLGLLLNAEIFSGAMD